MLHHMIIFVQSITRIISIMKIQAFIETYVVAAPCPCRPQCQPETSDEQQYSNNSNIILLRILAKFPLGQVL